ncbi:kinase-like domain-containing protein [Amylostereum chailletii]|nr:kinase-like domain-containing protein [Amylostereum chailletii]
MLSWAIASLTRPLVLSKRNKSSWKKDAPLSVSDRNDSDIAKLWNDNAKLDAGTFVSPLGGLNRGCIARIAHDTVVKRTTEFTVSSALTMQLVRRVTSIPVPRCDRFIDRHSDAADDGVAMLVMEYIEGSVLADVWSDLSLWMKFRVGVTVWHYIYQLRSFSRRHRPHRSGPLGDDEPCRGRYFPDVGAGPFATYKEMTDWFNNRLLLIRRFHKKALNTAPFDGRSPLVLTHMDLHLRNLILGKDGQLWVIDWAEAGFYPEWFEGANMEEYAELRQYPASWTRLIPWMAGRSDRPGQRPFVDDVRWALVVPPPVVMNLVITYHLPPSVGIASKYQCSSWIWTEEASDPSLLS